MSLTITYFVHGTTTDNESGLATGWLPGELSELGKQQAKGLGALVKDRFDAMISSDLKRATDSALLGFKGKCEFHPDLRLRECNYGDLNGTDEKRVKQDMLSHVSKPFPNGESYEDVEYRVRAFLLDVMKQYKGRKVAFMAHQAPQLALEVICNHKTWQEAIESDWRRVGKWQPGWQYIIS